MYVCMYAMCCLVLYNNLEVVSEAVAILISVILLCCKHFSNHSLKCYTSVQNFGLVLLTKDGIILALSSLKGLWCVLDLFYLQKMAWYLLYRVWKVCFCACVLYSFLNQCRPLSVSMGNAIKYLKNQITHISSSLNAEQVCAVLLSNNTLLYQFLFWIRNCYHIIRWS